ncbi:helix-turn-helix transcriptional regulator [Streptosporangium sp. G11]|uniref:helix-turn-helix transcriptional regulator n=1 Tax=Streptosporangium sp. G11 TaxID=3436926 RepID=UPI003EB7F02A
MTESGELGPALRHWRDRINPAEVGLPGGGPRRAAGLRREELAMLAGVSADYITRLEQSRATSPSAQILTALARALRLSDQEREHLFLLARQPPPTAGHMSTHLTPSLQRLLDQLDGTPLSVNDAAWNLIRWNRPWAALFGDPTLLVGRDRNVIWRHFTGRLERVSHTPEQEIRFETTAVADLRSATARYPSDTGLRSLVTDLRSVSPRFAELWDTHVVGAHESARKTVHHPEVGPLTLDCDVLTVPGSDLRIIVYSAAPGTEAADKLKLLSVIGTQTMRPS